MFLNRANSQKAKSPSTPLGEIGTSVDALFNPRFRSESERSKARVVTALLPSLVGLSLGMRHALEPDHLAAVSTLASEERGGLKASLRLGLFWGVGHTLSLLLVGGSLALLGAQMPAQLGFVFELLVAIMITALGLRAMARAVAEGRAGFEHTHEHRSGEDSREPERLQQMHCLVSADLADEYAGDDLVEAAPDGSGDDNGVIEGQRLAPDTDD